jgi:hypothetical protein
MNINSNVFLAIAFMITIGVAMEQNRFDIKNRVRAPAAVPVAPAPPGHREAMRLRAISLTKIEPNLFEFLFILIYVLVALVLLENTFQLVVCISYYVWN